MEEGRCRYFSLLHSLPPFAAFDGSPRGSCPFGYLPDIPLKCDIFPHTSLFCSVPTITSIKPHSAHYYGQEFRSRYSGFISQTAEVSKPFVRANGRTRVLDTAGYWLEVSLHQAADSIPVEDTGLMEKTS